MSPVSSNLNISNNLDHFGMGGRPLIIHNSISIGSLRPYPKFSFIGCLEVNYKFDWRLILLDGNAAASYIVPRNNLVPPTKVVLG